jgi:hypothetical protein
LTAPMWKRISTMGPVFVKKWKINSTLLLTRWNYSATNFGNSGGMSDEHDGRG